MRWLRNRAMAMPPQPATRNVRALGTNALASAAPVDRLGRELDGLRDWVQADWTEDASADIIGAVTRIQATLDEILSHAQSAHSVVDAKATC